MKIRSALAILYLVLIAAAAPAMARADDPADTTVINAVSAKDARDVLTSAGADVSKADYTSDGFTIMAALDADRHVMFEGLECKGAGEAMTCPEFKITAVWQLDSPAHVEAAVKKLHYYYTSVAAYGDELDLMANGFHLGRGHKEAFQQHRARVHRPETAG